MHMKHVLNVCWVSSRLPRSPQTSALLLGKNISIIQHLIAFHDFLTDAFCINLTEKASLCFWMKSEAFRGTVWPIDSEGCLIRVIIQYRTWGSSNIVGLQWIYSACILGYWRTSTKINVIKAFHFEC